jgi:hypothetical protein
MFVTPIILNVHAQRENHATILQVILPHLIHFFCLISPLELRCITLPGVIDGSQIVTGPWP